MNHLLNGGFRMAIRERAKVWLPINSFPAAHTNHEAPYPPLSYSFASTEARHGL